MATTASFLSPMAPRAAALTSPRLLPFPSQSTHSTSSPLSPLSISRVRKLHMSPSAKSRKKSPLDRIPKQFRIENLPDGLKEHYMNAPSSLHGRSFSQMDDFMDDTEETSLSAESSLEDPQLGNTVNSSIRASNGGMTSFDESFAFDVHPGHPDFRNVSLSYRIMYLDMPLVPDVVEDMASQLMWLRFEDETKPILMYINSIGAENPANDLVGNEMYAYGLAEMMLMFDDVHTVNMNRAYGEAAMLLSIGKKGHRSTFQSSRTKFHLPQVVRTSGSVSKMWLKGKLVEETAQRYIELVAQGTGKPKEEVADILQHRISLNSEETIKFGAADSIFELSEHKAWKEKFMLKSEERERLDPDQLKKGVSKIEEAME